jgi:hypothetical protein
MKLKPEAIAYNPNLENKDLDNATSQNVDDALFAILLPYADLFRRIAIGSFTLTTKLLPCGPMATLVAKLYNKLHEVSPYEAHHTLNEFNYFLSLDEDDFITKKAMRISQIPTVSGRDFLEKIYVVKDILAIQEYIRTIRDLALQQIPSLWEDESAE